MAMDQAGHDGRSIAEPLGEPASGNRRRTPSGTVKAHSRYPVTRAAFITLSDAPATLMNTGHADERHHDAETDEEIDSTRRRQVAVGEDLQIEDGIGTRRCDRRKMTNVAAAPAIQYSRCARRSGGRSVDAQLRASPGRR